MGDLVRPETLTVTLTADEQNVTLGALYERLSETGRYLAAIQSVIDKLEQR